MKDLSINIVDGQLFIKNETLISNGMAKSTLYSKLKKSREGKSLFYQNTKINGSVWINYKSIPTPDMDKYNLPKNVDELKVLFNKKNKNLPGKQRIDDLDRLFNWIWLTDYLWMLNILHYNKFFLDVSVRNQYAKTHAIIETIIGLKNKGEYSLIQMFNSYQLLNYVIFRTSDYKYFCLKIKQCEENTIPEVLIHNNIGKIKSPYHLKPFMINRIKYYYLNEKRYSQAKICSLVNEELVLRGLRPISLSTVARVCRDPELRNRADIVRLGRNHANQHINPYLSRKNASFIGELYMMDSTPLNFLCKDEKDTTSRLTLCAVIDVFSRKIVGYSFDTSENSKMICAALKQAFKSNHIMPKQILVDNAKPYKSDHFKDLKKKLADYGVSIRNARLKNPRDKSYIEGWFSKFQKEFLNNMRGSFGDGVKSKRIGGRASDEVIIEYNKSKNLENKFTLIKRISEQIEEYNNSYHNSIRTIPNIKFDNNKREYEVFFNEKDISYIFGKRKEVTIKNSKIVFINKGYKHHYTIFPRVIANKINGTKVTVYFDELDLSYVHLFNFKNEYIGKFSEDLKPNIVAKSKQDFRIYRKSNELIQTRIKDNLDELSGEINQGKEALELYPIINLDQERIKRMEMLTAENDEIIESSLKRYKMITKKSSSKIKLQYAHKLFSNRRNNKENQENHE